MSRIAYQLLLCLGSLLPFVSVITHAVPNEPGLGDRDYRVIVERNPFSLKPPPPPPTNAPPPAAPKDEILLTGITSIGDLYAYFMSKPPQNKPPEFYRLGIGDKKDGFEVLEIDPAAKSVRVRNAGVETVMTFASHGVKPPATPATPVPGAPGAAGAPGTIHPGGLPMPGGTAGATSPGATPGMATTATGNPANPTSATGNGRIRTIPSRTVRTAQPAFNPAVEPAPAPNPNAPLQDALMMELQKRANPNITFPPTPMPIPGR